MCVPIYACNVDVCPVKCGRDPRAVPDYVLTSGESLNDSDGPCIVFLICYGLKKIAISILATTSRGGSLMTPSAKLLVLLHSIKPQTNTLTNIVRGGPGNQLK